MKNKTTWYLIVEMNDGEWRCISEYTSKGVARQEYKYFVELSTSGTSFNYPNRHKDPIRALPYDYVKTIKLISVENRGNNDR